MKGGEIFVKKAPSIKIVDLAKILYKEKHGNLDGFDYKVIGIYPGEKIHEILISEEEGRRCIDKVDYFIIPPYKKMAKSKVQEYQRLEKPVLGENEEYCSKDEVASIAKITELLKKADKSASQEYYNRLYS